MTLEPMYILQWSLDPLGVDPEQAMSQELAQLAARALCSSLLLIPVYVPAYDGSLDEERQDCKTLGGGAHKSFAWKPGLETNCFPFNACT